MSFMVGSLALISQTAWVFKFQVIFTRQISVVPFKLKLAMKISHTVPIAQRMLFLMTEAMSSINSREVAHGSMQVVMIYFTELSLSGLS